eukprot:TRINITY_DN3158_c0_g1_i1.p1 TRINITY_DN3158_c0_g1~~TRINITY_DN3158_c0_g1_i1.p1  ORF type:complete len:280 (-),score=104.44 TRINITY_DN3158_c0_g1_i1:131-970(-)
MLREFEADVDEEIEAYLERLRLHTRLAAKGDGSGRGSGDDDGAEDSEPLAFAAVRRLADAMKASVLERLRRSSETWAEDEGRFAAADADAADSGAEARKQTLAATERCRELQRLLSEKRAREKALREQIGRKLKDECDARVKASVELLSALRAEVLDSQASSAGAGAGEAAEVREDFALHAARLRRDLDVAASLAARADARRAELQSIAQQQRRGLSRAERSLESTSLKRREAPEQEEEDEEQEAEARDDDLSDRELVETISQGEQICKRMRRHVAAYT